MLSVCAQKTAGDTVGESIELENVTVKVNMGINEERAKNISKLALMFHDTTHGTNTEYWSAFQPLFTSLAGNSLLNLKNFTVHLLNTDNMLHESLGLEPVYGVWGGSECVSYVEVDDAVYSGTSNIRGTVNLNESTQTFHPASIHRKLVLDFPTHASNGSINKIVFLPRYTTTTKHVYLGPNNRNFLRMYVKDLHGSGIYNSSVSTNTVVDHSPSGSFSDFPACYTSFAVKSNGEDYCGVYETSHQYQHLILRQNGKFYVSRSAFNKSVAGHRIYCINDKYYLTNTLNSGSAMTCHSDNNTREVSFTINESGNIVATLGSYVKPYPRPSKVGSDATNYSIQRIAHWLEKLIMIYSTGNKLYVDILDEDLSLLKCLEITSGVFTKTTNTWDTFHRTTPYINFGSHIVIGSHVIGSDLEFVNGISYPIDYSFCSVNSGAKPNCIIGAINGGHVSSSTTAGCTLVGELDFVKPIIEFDFSEPLQKTDAETLKLTFDLQIDV